MKRILYLECKSGISGDMTVAALLDLGADRDELLRVLASLDLSGYSVKIGRTRKNEIEACDFNVLLDEGSAHHHFHGHSHEQSQDHQHIRDHHHHDHGHSHEHCQDHQHIRDHHHDLDPGHHHHESNGQQQAHRNVNDIFKIIDASLLPAKAKQLARKMFTIVAQAESKAHGLPVDQVHFHEVGAVDSIVDIAAAAFCLDNLGLDEVVVSPLAEGQGEVHCQHGLLPVPVPAVVNILSAHGLPVTITDNNGEMITPTGAAIAAAARTRDKLPEKFTILKIGLGAGKKDFTRPNILRAMLLKDETGPDSDGVWVLEANIDDCPGEALAFTLEELFRLGARDAFFMPVFMKKNRPAYLLKIICDHEQIENMEKIVFTHTTTIGIRRCFMERTVLARKIIDLETEYGPAKVKKVSLDGGFRFYPEYESVKKICRSTGRSFQEIYRLLRDRAERA